MDPKYMSVIIIDDEPAAINLLEMFLRQFPQVKVTGKETNAKNGLEMVMATLPELVFLDIDMPDMNGLQVANKIHSGNFYSEIVFTTAHEHYAFDALGIEPLYFLTKPFSTKDLEVVLQKYQAKIEQKNKDRKLDNFIHSQNISPKITLPVNYGLLLVSIKDIVLIKSKGNKSILYLFDGMVEEVNLTLTKMMSEISSPAFFQIHRTVFVNLNYMQRLDKKKSTCILSFNNSTLEEKMSKTFLAHFEKLNLFPAYHS